MDFHKMKRSELQELCKKNSIRANLTNLEMVNRLSSLYKVKDKEKPMRGGQSENDCDFRNPRKKKVRFRAGNDVCEHEEDMKAAKSKMRGVENEASTTRLTRATAGASLGGQKSALSSLIVDLTDAAADDDKRTEVVSGKSLRNRKVDSVVVSKKNTRGRSTRSQSETDSAEVSEKKAALADGKITKIGSQRSTWNIAKHEEDRIVISKKSLRPRGAKSSDEVPETSLSKIQEKKVPMRRGRSCLKNSDEASNGNDSGNANRRLKKVKFSPEIDVVEVEDMKFDVNENKRIGRATSRKRALEGKGSQFVENEGSLGRVTRASKRVPMGGHKILASSAGVVKKQEKRAVKEVEKSDNADVKGTEVISGKSLRNRKVDTVVVSSKNVRKRTAQERSESNSAEASEHEANMADGITDLRRTKQNVDKFGEFEIVGRRKTRSRTQQAAKASDLEGESESEPVDKGRHVVSRKDLRQRGGNNKSGKFCDEVSKNNAPNENARTTRSRRKMEETKDSDGSNAKSDNTDVVGKKIIRSVKDSTVNSESQTVKEDKEENMVSRKNLRRRTNASVSEIPQPGKTEMAGKRKNTRGGTRFPLKASTVNGESGTKRVIQAQSEDESLAISAVRKSKPKEQRQEVVVRGEIVEPENAPVVEETSRRFTRSSKSPISEVKASLPEGTSRRVTRGSSKRNTDGPTYVTGNLSQKKSRSVSNLPLLDVEASLAEVAPIANWPTNLDVQFSLPKVAVCTVDPVSSTSDICKDRTVSATPQDTYTEANAGTRNIKESKTEVEASPFESPVEMPANVEAQLSFSEVPESIIVPDLIATDIGKDNNAEANFEIPNMDHLTEAGNSDDAENADVRITVADGFSLVDQGDSMCLAEEPQSSKDAKPSSIVVNHGVVVEGATVDKEQPSSETEPNVLHLKAVENLDVAENAGLDESNFVADGGLEEEPQSSKDAHSSSIVVNHVVVGEGATIHEEQPISKTEVNPEIPDLDHVKPEEKLDVAENAGSESRGLENDDGNAPKGAGEASSVNLHDAAMSTCLVEEKDNAQDINEEEKDEPPLSAAELGDSVAKGSETLKPKKLTSLLSADIIVDNADKDIFSRKEQDESAEINEVGLLKDGEGGFVISKEVIMIDSSNRERRDTKMLQEVNFDGEDSGQIADVQDPMKYEEEYPSDQQHSLQLDEIGESKTMLAADSVQGGSQKKGEATGVEETIKDDFEGNICIDGNGNQDLDGEVAMVEEKDLGITCSTSERSIAVISEERDIDQDNDMSMGKTSKKVGDELELEEVIRAKETDDECLFKVNSLQTVEVEIRSPGPAESKQANQLKILLATPDMTPSRCSEKQTSGPGCTESYEGSRLKNLFGTPYANDGSELRSKESDGQCLVNVNSLENNEKEITSPSLAESKHENQLKNLFATPDVTSSRYEKQTSRLDVENSVVRMTWENITNKMELKERTDENETTSSGPVESEQENPLEKLFSTPVSTSSGYNKVDDDCLFNVSSLQTTVKEITSPGPVESGQGNELEGTALRSNTKESFGEGFNMGKGVELRKVENEQDSEKVVRENNSIFGMQNNVEEFNHSGSTENEQDNIPQDQIDKQIVSPGPLEQGGDCREISTGHVTADDYPFFETAPELYMNFGETGSDFETMKVEDYDGPVRPTEEQLKNEGPVEDSSGLGATEFSLHLDILSSEPNIFLEADEVEGDKSNLPQKNSPALESSKDAGEEKLEAKDAGVIKNQVSDTDIPCSKDDRIPVESTVVPNKAHLESESDDAVNVKVVNGDKRDGEASELKGAHVDTASDESAKTFI